MIKIRFELETCWSRLGHFVLWFNIPGNYFSVMSRWTHHFMDVNQYSGELMCFAQGLAKIEPRSCWFGVQSSTTRPLHSPRLGCSNTELLCPTQTYFPEKSNLISNVLQVQASLAFLLLLLFFSNLMLLSIKHFNNWIWFHLIFYTNNYATVASFFASLINAICCLLFAYTSEPTGGLRAVRNPRSISKALNICLFQNQKHFFVQSTIG